MRSPLRPPRPARATTLLGSPSRNFTYGLTYMAVVMMVATAAYVAAGWSPGDALYMVVVTVYTVGYNEVRPVDTALLRMITIGTIVLGCTGVIFLTGALVQFITLNELNQVFGVKRMTRQIETLTGHAIICGFGRIGALLAHDLSAARAGFVVVEQDPRRAEQARALNYLCIQADATDEDALQQAGVERARVLATVLSADAANVFITLSARKLNAGLEIIARGEAPSTESKLLQAGANRVVLPTHIGAERMVEMILYQETERLIRGSDRMLDFEKVLLTLGLNLEVVVAEPDSPAVGKTVEVLEREASNACFIVQVDDQASGTLARPEPSTRIKAGDGILLVSRGVDAHVMFKAGSRSTFRKSAR